MFPIVRSQTGMYHYGLGPMKTTCGNFRNRKATEKEIETAKDSAFCDKCFNGRRPINPTE